MRLKWNRKITILVLFMFITITFASFNTNLFIDGKAYVRADESVRITNIELVENTNQAYETYEPEYTKNTITINTNLPKQNSTAQYRITIQNNSNDDYDVQDIIEQTYSNNKISYNITGLTIDDTILEAHTTSTFLLTLSNNTTITEEEDVYQTLTYTFDYTGDEQEFIVPYDGEYTLEVWGASGRNVSVYEGSYGGYSKGNINLKSGQKIYITVGRAGTLQQRKLYNGGGIGDAGGGAGTHISTMKGLLSTLENYKDNILIVAGGGGGHDVCNNANLSGGGFKGASHGSAKGGEQTPNTGTYKNIGSFGQGGSSLFTDKGAYLDYGGGGGGGYYGGDGSPTSGSCGAGGSGYIGNNKLSKKVMYCFNCEESNDTATKTISTSNHSTEPISEYAKQGDGYAKITITRKIEDSTNYDFNYIGDEQTFTAPYTGIYKLETWGAQGGTINESYYGGYGAYSTGQINLNKNQTVYINNGGAGTCRTLTEDNKTVDGGYNGGGQGNSGFSNRQVCGGGGATHMATATGLLSELDNNRDSILIVSGGGAGSWYFGDASSKKPGHGGGYKGTAGKNGAGGNCGVYTASGGEQTSAGESGMTFGTFGQGGGQGYAGAAGGGGGYYGGNSTCFAGGGGSGYIGNTNLYDKKMYCYDCDETQNENSKTISTQSHTKSPKQNVAKEGNGYSRITLVQRLSNNIELSLKFDIQKLTDYNITYNLDGGTLDEPIDTYTRNTENFTLPTPKKTGYTFVGWTGGKGLFEPTYIVEHQVYGNGDTSFTSSKRGMFDVKPNTYYTLSTNLFKRADNGRYVAIASSDDINCYLSSQQSGAYEDNPITVQSTSNGHIIISLFNHLFTQENWNALLNGTYWIQIEEGNKVTNYEPIIKTPNNNISITKGSRGNRTYTAVWEPINYNIEYDLDGGSFESNTVHPTTYNIETPSFAISNPVRSGYTFLGWEETHLNIKKRLDKNEVLMSYDDTRNKFVVNNTKEGNVLNSYKMQQVYINLNSGNYVDRIYKSTAGLIRKEFTNTRQSGYYSIRFGANGSTNDGCEWYWVQFEENEDYIFESNLEVMNSNLIEVSDVRIYKKGDSNYSIPPSYMPTGSYGNRTLKAIWKDSTAPTLSLKKETYLTTEDINWTFSNGSMDSNGVANFPAGDSTAYMNSGYVDINYSNWYITYETYTEGVSSASQNGGGQYLLSTFYYDENYERVVAYQTFSQNGVAREIPINEWIEVPAFDGYGTGSKSNLVKYIQFYIYGQDSNYVVSPTKIRNVKLHLNNITNDFYDIIIKSSDNVGVTTTKYAAGSHNASYFESNGTDVTDNKVRVTSNGTYTVYVADAEGNATVQEIEITNIVNAD